MPPALPGVVRLPRHVEPADDEALSSWTARLGADLGCSPLLFGQAVVGVDVREEPEWWRRPSDATLARLAVQTGIAAARLRAMTFLGWETARGDEEPQRFAGGRWSGRPRRPRGRPVELCPQCLSEDRRPYLRRLWLLGWAGACPRHRTVLTGECPHCWAALRLRSLAAGTPTGLLDCRRCGAPLTGPAGEPAHPRVLALQDALLAGKRTGVAMLGDIGPLDWVTVTAVVDMLLGMVWAEVTPGRRERLFARVVGDCGIGVTEACTLPWASNYGGLLLLSWFLEDLGSRVPAALTILRARRFGRMLARLGDLDADLEGRLRRVLAPALPRPPVNRRAWRVWIDGLRETATELRARAAGERYKHRRQRLTAFAVLREGGSIEAAAAAVRMNPRSVCIWLRRGMASGLEAALERPTGKAALTAVQAEALGQWIAADRANQNRRAIAAKAGDLFCVELSVDAASRLLAKHRRMKPGRRRRLWTPGPYRRRQGGAAATHDRAPGP